jgi:hypothetical protein
MYMDIHEVPGATPEAVARAHEADLAHQGEHGVEYLKYWVNENTGTVFCLCKAPSSEAATAVHRESHGLVASKIIEVVPEVAENFLGASAVDSAGRRSCPEAANTTPRSGRSYSPISSSRRRWRSA